jgi:hypothetical protein
MYHLNDKGIVVKENFGLERHCQLPLLHLDLHIHTKYYRHFSNVTLGTFSDPDKVMTAFIVAY